jgi:hypothetical protein
MCWVLWGSAPSVCLHICSVLFSLAFLKASIPPSFAVWLWLGEQNLLLDDRGNSGCEGIGSVIEFLLVDILFLDLCLHSDCGFECLAKVFQSTSLKVHLGASFVCCWKEKWSFSGCLGWGESTKKWKHAWGEH